MRSGLGPRRKAQNSMPRPKQLEQKPRSISTNYFASCPIKPSAGGEAGSGRRLGGRPARTGVSDGKVPLSLPKAPASESVVEECHAQPEAISSALRNTERVRGDRKRPDYWANHLLSDRSKPWFWMIDLPFRGSRRHPWHGFEATRQAAMEVFDRSWHANRRELPLPHQTQPQ